MSGFLIAYLVVWLGVVLYVGRLGVQQRRLERTLEALRAQVEESQNGVSSAAKAA